MKRRILIFSHAMEIGGAERSLLGLLEAIDQSKYDIDLFLMRHQGEFLKFIPDYVNFLPEVRSYTVLARPMLQILKEGHFILAFGRLKGSIAARRYSKKMHYSTNEVALEYSHKYTKKWMPQINPSITYDIAISFLTPHYFVAEKVKAKKKIAWIHTDYSKINIDIESELKMWDAYDNIISISEAVSKSFLHTFPSLNKKVIVIENILPQKTIYQQMKNESINLEQMKEGKIKLLSIGRYCEAKNFDNVPQILAEIRKYKIDVHWYLLGYGPDEKLIQKRIREAHMERYVHMLKKTDNPYPFIQACDLYIQPSRYEGRCVTVKEAQMLGKPVIITRYETSFSQLEENVDGVIVEMNNVDCAEGIVRLLKDEEKMKKIVSICKTRDYSNMEEVEKVYQLI